MRSFTVFREWSRGSSPAERIGTLISASLAVALLAWLLVPGSVHDVADLATSGTPTDGVPTVGTIPGSTAPGATPLPDGQATNPGAPSAAGPTASTLAGAAVGSGCTSPPGSAPGVSAEQIKVGIVLTEVIGPIGNSAVGVAPTAQQQKWYEAVIDSINKGGGVACRKVVPQFFKANPADQSNLQQVCLDIVQSNAYVAIDNGAYAYFPQKQCYAQHEVPYFGGYYLTRTEMERSFPYLFNIAEFDVLMRNTILGLRQIGFFDPAKGFKKLGFVYQDCDSRLIDTTLKAIDEVGLTSSLVTYSVGCPSTFASPSDLAGAVLKFRQNGVTHVTTAHFIGDIRNFTQIAEQQGFRPRYGLPDDSLIDTTYGTQAPNYDNIANAIAITSGRSGEERTPGMTPSSGTQRCDAIYAAHGIAPTYKLPAGAGYACDALWMFQAAVNNAASLQRSALAAGLQRTKTIDFSYPGGPTDFSQPRVTTGGHFWRVAQFMPSCSCWQVVDREFHPPFGE
jgi:hypothetical protein